MNTKDVRIQLKGDTRETWESNNPVLLENEIGIENDNGAVKVKIGDGETNWQNLNYPMGYVTESGGFVAGDESYAAEEGIAIGHYAKADEFGAIAIGRSTNAHYEKGVAIGTGASSYYGFSGGSGTWTDTGGAVGLRAVSIDGGAIGSDAYSVEGGAVGLMAVAYDGAAVGKLTRTDNGVAAGANAQTVNESNEAIDAIQLGTGTNMNEKTMQVYDYPLLDAEGKIYSDRLPEAAAKDSRVPGEIITTYGSPPDDTWVLCDGSTQLFDNTDEELCKNLISATLNNATTLGFDGTYYYRVERTITTISSTDTYTFNIYIFQTLLDCINLQNYLYKSEDILTRSSKYSMSTTASCLIKIQDKMILCENYYYYATDTTTTLYSINCFNGNLNDYSLDLTQIISNPDSGYKKLFINPYTEDIIQMVYANKKITFNFLNAAGAIIETINPSIQPAYGTIQVTINDKTKDIIIVDYSSSGSGANLILIDKNHSIYTYTYSSRWYYSITYLKDDDLYLFYRTDYNYLYLVQIVKNADNTLTLNYSPREEYGAATIYYPLGNIKNSPYTLYKTSTSSSTSTWKKITIIDNTLKVEAYTSQSTDSIDMNDGAVKVCFDYNTSSSSNLYDDYLFRSIRQFFGDNIIYQQDQIFGDVILKTTPTLTSEDGSRTYIKQ